MPGTTIIRPNSDDALTGGGSLAVVGAASSNAALSDAVTQPAANVSGTIRVNWTPNGTANPCDLTLGLSTFTIPAGEYVSALTLWVRGEQSNAFHVGSLQGGSLPSYPGNLNLVNGWTSVTQSYAVGDVSQASLDALQFNWHWRDASSQGIATLDVAYVEVVTSLQVAPIAVTFPLVLAGPGECREQHVGGTFPKVTF